MDATDANGNPLDLTLATGTKFRLREDSGTTLLINNSTIGLLSGIKKSHYEYDWNASDWTPVKGQYRAELEVDFATGGPLILPQVGYWSVIVSPILP